LTTWKGKTVADYLNAFQHGCDQKINVIGQRAIAKDKDQTYCSALVVKPQIPR